MASDKTIHLRIDVTKVNKAWFFKGKKGTYLDVTLFYNEEQDEYGNNGMIVQSVPADIYKKEKAAGLPKEKRSRGEILGNAKDWASGGGGTEARREASPGFGVTGEEEDERPAKSQKTAPVKKQAAKQAEEEEEEEIADDLPF